MEARHGGRRTVTVVLTVTLLATLTACGVPIPDDPADVPQGAGAGPGPGAGSGEDVDRLEPDDTRLPELVASLERVHDAVVEARALLDTAATVAAELAPDATAGTTDLTDVNDLADAAVRVLIGPTGDGAPALLPATDPDRAGPGSDDLVSTLITLAGDAGGASARLVLELVRDPMLGDLGAWQRDPVGVIAVVRGRTEPATTPVALDTALGAQPGELTRALGYALATAATDDPDLAAHAARQGAGRLGVVRIAVELAIERLEGTA